VETILFPDLKDKNLFLRSVDVNENMVQSVISQGLSIFKANTVGPQKYVFTLS